MSNRLIRLSTVIVCAGLLAACANPRQKPVYEENGTWSGQRAGLQYGVIRSIEDVSSRQSTSGAGALIGGVVGAVVGRQLGGSSEGRTTGTIVGAIGGAIAGNEIEHHNTQPAGRYRVQVEIDGGQMRTFNLAQLGDLKPGDRVVVDGQSVRRY
ncbi:MAG: glycine zipper 2TM domain-containing protein [Burkholderiales bacterium]|nr:glycine zipper 2TM domain-containing protein [Burkholderiales bacterium]